MEAQEAADTAHAQFRDENSDFLGFLKLWNFYREKEKHLSAGQLRKLCQTNFLSYFRMREWNDIHQQLKSQVNELGMDRGLRR